MSYRIEIPFLDTGLSMPDAVYNELEPIKLFYKKENITEKGRMIALGGGFVLICPEKEFEVVNE